MVPIPVFLDPCGDQGNRLPASVFRVGSIISRGIPKNKI